MDETGFLEFGNDTYALEQAAEAAANVGVPTTYADFNQGGSWNPLAIIQGGTQILTSVAGAAAQLMQIPNTFALNRATLEQNAALQRAQLAAQGQVGLIGLQSRVAQAQREYNLAAGVGQPSLVVILAIGGVVLLVVMLASRK